MNIVVCVKRVPMTQDVDLEIDASKKNVQQDMLAYVLNEWDNYAIEEAILLKEKFGGMVTAVTIGGEDDEESLRRCLAMGADRAIRIEPGDMGLDGFVIANILADVIKGEKCDLILTGVQADDNNCGEVGIMLAELLELPHSAVVTNIEVEGSEAVVKMELEGGVDEAAKINLPALMTIQTGINEPRYVSIMGIRKAAKKELKVLKVEDLNLSEDNLTQRTIIEKYFFPPETEGAEIIDGDPATVAAELLRIFKEKGVTI